MNDKRFSKSELYQNRELSWLSFNRRVLEEGLDAGVPLMERLKFFSIVSSNLDEFFMIRAAGLHQQRAATLRKRDLSGLTPQQQLSAIAVKTHALVAVQTQGIKEVLEQLKGHGLGVLSPLDWSGPQTQYASNYFSTEILPMLTPLAIEELSPSPLLPSLQLNLAFLVTTPGRGPGEEAIVVVPIPGRLPRFVPLPYGEKLCLARIEDVVSIFADRLLPGQHILASAIFRITRDADIEIQDDDAADLLSLVEKAILDRRRRQAVRLELSAAPDERISRWLVHWLGLRTEEVYEIDGMLDASALMQVANLPGFDALSDPEWPAQTPRDLVGADNLWDRISQQDVLLLHPYEAFDPVIQLIEQAADDPNVIAIKQTLYRTGSDSPVIRGLERAARNGKQVTVLMELKARFDEARNVESARRLEDAGCLVIYGIVGYKTHSKALLIVRREQARIRRYVHLSTGNYNHKTARLYSDIGLMTANSKIAADVAEFFNLLTGHSELVELSSLAIAPTDMRGRFLELIDREIHYASLNQPAVIMVKINSLEDRQLIQALYHASAAGVKIKLNVRGICCLRPGVKRVSENIEVRSVVDRYLEHSRIFYFHNGGHYELYLSSADWMARNLDKRLELMFPVIDHEHKRRLLGVLELYFQDNVKARVLKADGTYQAVSSGTPAIRVQERLYQMAVEAGQISRRDDIRFKPMTHA